MVELEGKPATFAQLISLFTVELKDFRTHQHTPLALVQLYSKQITPTERAKDKPFSLYRVRRKAAAQPCIIPARAIVRGCLLAPTNKPNKPNDAFVFDILDGEIYLRVRELW